MLCEKLQVAPEDWVLMTALSDRRILIQPVTPPEPALQGLSADEGQDPAGDPDGSGANPPAR